MAKQKTNNYKVIIGPDIDKDDVAPLGNNVVGDGIRGLTQEEISATLAQSSATLNIHYLGHGNVVTYSDTTYKHMIDIFGKTSPTIDVLASDKDKDGIRHVWSCRGGAAKYAVEALGENKPLILHSGEKFTTLIPMNVEGILAIDNFCQKMQEKYHRMPNAYEIFEFSMLTSPETVIISEFASGKAESFKGRAPQRTADIESLERYLEDQLYRFRVYYRYDVLNQNQVDFISLEEMKAMLPADYLQRYRQLAMMTESNRKDPNKPGKHIKYVSEHMKFISPAFTIRDGFTPLDLACFNGDVELAKLLLKHKDIKIDQPNRDGFTPLYLACYYGHDPLAKFLIKSGANINRKLQYGQTYLHFACQNGHLNAVKILLENNANLNITLNGFTPLDIAWTKGHTEIVKYLLDNGEDVNKENQYLATPLYTACSKGQNDIVKLLVEKVEIELEKKCSGISPLEIAWLSGNFEAVKLILRALDDLDISDQYLHKACEQGNKDIVRFLLQQGCDPNKLNKGVSPLYAACNNSHTDVAKLILLQPDVDVNQANKSGLAPLHIACEKGKMELVKILLEKDAKPGETLTALMIAALYGKKEVVDLLLQHTKDHKSLQKTVDTKFFDKNTAPVPNIVSTLLGKSASDIARLFEHDEIAKKIGDRCALLEKLSENKDLDISLENRGDVTFLRIKRVNNKFMEKDSLKETQEQFRDEIKSGQFGLRDHFDRNRKMVGYSLREPQNDNERKTWAERQENHRGKERK
jgi:ankyrin repeat protein